MNIKARICKKGNEQCICCLKHRNKVLDIFEIYIPLGENGDYQSLILCDECIDQLFCKTLRCTCYTNARTKSEHDLAVCNSRRRKKFVERHGEYTLPINLPKEQESEEDRWEKIMTEYEDD